MGGKGSEDNKWGKMREEKRNPGARIGIGLSPSLFSSCRRRERESKCQAMHICIHLMGRAKSGDGHCCCYSDNFLKPLSCEEIGPHDEHDWSRTAVHQVGLKKRSGRFLAGWDGNVIPYFWIGT